MSMKMMNAAYLVDSAALGASAGDGGGAFGTGGGCAFRCGRPIGR